MTDQAPRDEVASPVPRRQRATGSEAKVLGLVLGLFMGLLYPLVQQMMTLGAPPGPKPYDLAGQLQRNPLWLMGLLAGLMALAAAWTYFCVCILEHFNRPRMSDRHKPLFFRYGWGIQRFLLQSALWATIGGSVGYFAALVLVLTGIYPQQPPEELVFFSGISLSMGTGGLLALKTGPKRRTARSDS